MKVSFDITKQSIIVLILFVGLLVFSFVLGWQLGPEKQINDVECLTVQDLNRSDIVNAAFFARFCEGMGYSSSLFWEKDLNGQIFAIPICVERQQ